MSSNYHRLATRARQHILQEERSMDSPHLTKRRPKLFPIFLITVLLLGVYWIFAGTTDASSREWRKTLTSSLSLGKQPKKAIVYGTQLAEQSADSWLNEYKTEYDVFHYSVENSTDGSTLQTPTWYGREAAVYLTYIIDHYRSLPEYVIFFHGHRTSWHQPEDFGFVLSALNYSAVSEHGWINLRCANNPSCLEYSFAYMGDNPGTDRDWWRLGVRAVFGYIYQPSDPWYRDDIPLLGDLRIPPVFGSACCGQFVVDRKNIWAKPIEFWIRAREPLLKVTAEWINPVPAVIADTNYPTMIDSWKIGVFYERMWHYFFGKDAITCMDEEYCRRVVYQDRIHCNNYTATWPESQNYEKDIQCQLLQ